MKGPSHCRRTGRVLPELLSSTNERPPRGRVQGRVGRACTYRHVRFEFVVASFLQGLQCSRSGWLALLGVLSGLFWAALEWTGIIGTLCRFVVPMVPLLL